MLSLSRMECLSMSQPIQATIKSSIELHRTLSPITISSLQITSSEKTHTVAQILVPPIPNLTKTALLQSNKTIQPITARRRTIRNIFRSNRIVLQEMIIHQQLSFSRNPTMNSSTSREISHRMAKGNPVVDSEAITQVKVTKTYSQNQIRFQLFRNTAAQTRLRFTAALRID